MDDRRQCKFCSWRRTLSMLLTIYMVTSIGQSEVQTDEKAANHVTLMTSTTPTYPTSSTTQKAISKYTCKPTCEVRDLQLRCKANLQGCEGILSCKSAFSCTFGCNGSSFITFSLIIKSTGCIDTDDSKDKSLKCAPMNGQTLEIVKPDSFPWSSVFSNRSFKVKCVPDITMCTAKGCCLHSWLFNCSRFLISIQPVLSTPPTMTIESTSSNTTTTSTVHTSARPTTPSSTSTVSTSTIPTKPPRPSTKKTPSPPPSSTKLLTSDKSTSPNATSITDSQSPKILTSTDPIQTVTDEGGFKASQADATNTPTIVTVVSLFVLTAVVISIIVIIVLRRSRRKGTENPEFMIDNTAYGEARPHPKTDPVPDIPMISNGTPAKSKPDEDHTYCYASFDDTKETGNNTTKHVTVQDPNNAMKSSEDSYFVLEKEGQQHDNKHETEEANVVKVNKEQQQMNNKQDNPSNYFVLENVESVYDNSRQENIESENYFVLDTASDERIPDMKDDMSENDGTCLEEVDVNYFHVAKSDAGTTADCKQPSTASSIHSTIENQNTDNDKYFVLDKITDDRKAVNQIKLTDVGNSRTDDIRMINRRTTEDDTSLPTKGTPTTTAVDPYDHVRIGHAQTNGFDDGVYDELRKQRVRYDCEVVDDDYDHCGKRQ